MRLELVIVRGLDRACRIGPSAFRRVDHSRVAPAGSATAGLAATADVPVGGGVILADPALVITQPTAGDFKAFSSICTHQGCAVAEVTANEIVCPCHGSKFSATDGSVLTGPRDTGARRHLGRRAGRFHRPGVTACSRWVRGGCPAAWSIGRPPRVEAYRAEGAE